MKRMMTAVAGVSLLALAGSAAADSLVLSDTQMDNVTAGATAVFDFATIAVGDWGTISGASVIALTDTGPGGLNGGLDYASVQLTAGSVANSVLGPAASQTAGSIGSSLP